AHAGRTSGAYREQNVGADKPVGACYLGSEFVISRILDGFDRAESGVGDAVEVISHAPALRSQPVFDPALGEVGFLARSGQVGVIHREHQPTTRSQCAGRVPQGAVQITQVLTDQTTQRAIEPGFGERQPSLQITGHQPSTWGAALSHPQYAQREVSTHGIGSLLVQPGQVAAGATPQVQHPITPLDAQQTERVTSVHRHHRIRREIVTGRPQVIASTRLDPHPSGSNIIHVDHALRSETAVSTPGGERTTVRVRVRCRGYRVFRGQSTRWTWIAASDGWETSELAYSTVVSVSEVVCTGELGLRTRVHTSAEIPLVRVPVH